MISKNQTKNDSPSSDLKIPVSDTDHAEGSPSAAVTLTEYGDFGCRFCGEADQVVKRLQLRFGASLRFIFRHNPRGELHPNARITAEASEAAALQGKFWEMHDTLFAHPHALTETDMSIYAEKLGLDVEQFNKDLHSAAIAKRVREDEIGGVHSCIISTPTFFVNGARFHGTPSFEELAATISATGPVAEVAPTATR